MSNRFLSAKVPALADRERVRERVYQMERERVRVFIVSLVPEKV